MISVWMACVGVVVLVIIAVCIGASLDTEAQRRERRRVAAERHRSWLARRAVDDRHRGLCEDCPLRKFL